MKEIMLIIFSIVILLAVSFSLSLYSWVRLYGFRAGLREMIYSYRYFR